MNPSNLPRSSGAALAAAFVLAFCPFLSAQTSPGYTASGFDKMHQGNYDGAIADFNEALKAQPADAEAIYGRGDAEFLQGNFDGGIADFSKAIELKPDYPAAYFQRGLARAAQTNLVGACEDLAKAYVPKSSNHSLNDYAVLYRNLFSLRMGNTPDPRIRNTTGWSSEWTRALAAFLTQQIRETQLLNAARTQGGEDKSLQQGEALYFVGVLKLMAGDKATAKMDFQKCLNTCVESSVAHRMAETELDHI